MCLKKNEKNPVCETVVWSLADRVKNLIEKTWPGLSDIDMVTGGLKMFGFTQKNFVIFSENIALFETIVRWKTVPNLISNKKAYIHFRRQTSLSLQKVLSPQERFFTVFSENTAFF